MEHQYERMAELLVKEITGDLSEEEIKGLDLIRKELKLTDQMLARLRNPAYLAAQFKLLDELHKKDSRPIHSAGSYLYRAAIIVAITVTSWLFLSKPQPIPQPVNAGITFENVDIQTVLDLYYPDKGYKVKYDQQIKPRCYSGSLNGSFSMNDIERLLRQNKYNLTVNGKTFFVHL